LVLTKTDLLVIGWHIFQLLFMINHRNMACRREGRILNHISLYIRLGVILTPRHNLSS
jgi:hypothetical protein